MENADITIQRILYEIGHISIEEYLKIINEIYAKILNIKVI